MRLCSDTGRLRRQRLWTGGEASGVLIVGILLVHTVWPMQSWTRGGFWILWLAVLAAGAWVSIKPRRNGSYACFDDEGVSVQVGWGTRRLAWSEIKTVSRHELKAGAYRMDFEGPHGRGLWVDMTVFADEAAVYAMVRKHLGWADADHWTTSPSFRVNR